MLGGQEAMRRLEAVVAADVAALSTTATRSMAREVNQLRGFLDRVDVELARRVRELATGPASATPADVLDSHGRRTRTEARAAEERARACDELPGFDDALATGTVSSGHVDAIARATKDASAEVKAHVTDLAGALLSFAATETITAFDRRCRNLVHRLSTERDAQRRLEQQRQQSNVRCWVDKTTGMYHTHTELDPERGAKLAAALQAQLDAVKERDGNADVPIDRLRAEAMCELVTLTAGRVEPRVPEVHVHIDWKTLLSGVHEHSLCELTDGTNIPVSTVRRLCCEAVVVPILLGPDGMPVDCGRTRRTANRKQRRVLRNMYRTCAHPTCEVPFDVCHIHHVISWLDHGDTDLDNLLPLCNRHHHLIHEGGWSLTMTVERVITFLTPDGQIWFQGTTHERPADTDEPLEHAGAPPGARPAAA